MIKVWLFRSSLKDPEVGKVYLCYNVSIYVLSIITANSTVKGLIILGHVVELTLHPCTEIDLCWKNKCGFEIHEFCGFLQGLKIPLCLSHWNGYWVNGIQRSFVLYIVRGEGSAVPPRLTERVTNYRLMLKITSKHTHLNNPSPVGIISCQEKNTKIESTVCFLFRWCMRLTSL